MFYTGRPKADVEGLFHLVIKHQEDTIKFS